MNNRLACAAFAATMTAPLGLAAQGTEITFDWLIRNCLDETNRADLCKAFRNGIRYAVGLGVDPGNVLTAKVVVPLDNQVGWNDPGNLARLEDAEAIVSVRPTAMAARTVIDELAKYGSAQPDGTYSMGVTEYDDLPASAGEYLAVEQLAIPLSGDGNAIAAAKEITDAVNSLPDLLQPASRVVPVMPDSITVLPYPGVANFDMPVPGAAIP